MSKQEFLDRLAGKESRRLRDLGPKLKKAMKARKRSELEIHELASEIQEILHRHSPGERHNFKTWAADTFEYYADKIEKKGN